MFNYGFFKNMMENVEKFIILILYYSKVGISFYFLSWYNII